VRAKPEDREGEVLWTVIKELAGVPGGMTGVEGVLRAAALMRGIAYPCLSINDPVTIREGYICDR